MFPKREPLVAIGVFLADVRHARHYASQVNCTVSVDFAEYTVAGQAHNVQ